VLLEGATLKKEWCCWRGDVLGKGGELWLLAGLCLRRGEGGRG
jgi:hypothetical protein